MKSNLIFLFIIAALISCKEEKIQSIANLKSNNISQYIDSSNSGSINENWVGEDSLFLADLNKILRKDEEDIIEILKIDISGRPTNLGFGFKQIKGSYGKGYAGIYYHLILKNGNIISYEFEPSFPSNKGLTKRYLKLFSGVFKVEGNVIHNRYYQMEKMEKPLLNMNPEIELNENLRFLMSPFSGTRYGFSGGLGGTIITNRALFLEESGNLTPEFCQILMSSINPATRLMAIEYYLKNKSNFTNDSFIKYWIDRVYIELPKTETLEGDIVRLRDCKELVLEYVR